VQVVWLFTLVRIYVYLFVVYLMLLSIIKTVPSNSFVVLGGLSRNKVEKFAFFA